MSRKYHEEGEFGSDSFLDVLANLVGILIILIVVVGVRISNMPPEQLTATESTSQASVEAASPVIELPQVKLSVRELPPLPTFTPLPEIRPTEEMLTQAEKLKIDYEQLSRARETAAAQEAELAQRLRDKQAEIEAMQKQLSQSAVAMKPPEQLKTLEEDVNQLRMQVAALKQQAELIESDQPPVEEFKHYLPPIGRVVSGEEAHFRLHGNRVTHVPLTTLVREVQMDMERRKDILLNRSFFQGNTRPVEGYMMEYVLQRQSGNLNDDLRYGRGMIRIGVSSWIVKPVGPLRQETAEEAMQSGSEFYRVLSEHGPTSTITFWVYPDSFEIHQKLKAFTHKAGYWVASRPLPTGVPIAGSPQGSKSVAQ